MRIGVKLKIFKEGVKLVLKYFKSTFDFVKKNIRCNSIAPGTVFSPSWQDRVNQSPDPVQAKKDFIARQPMGRLGTAEEIAAVAVYLASDDATFTTGTTISVDGGMINLK